MAGQPKRVRVSSGEMEIVSMLWEEGPLTLAEAVSLFRATAMHRWLALAEALLAATA